MRRLTNAGFMLGRVCANHVGLHGKRYVSDGKCPACAVERHARWKKAHPDRARELSAQWRKANPEKVREKHERWKKQHPDSERERAARRRKAHPHKFAEYKARWYAANKPKAAALKAKRRAKQIQRTPSWLTQLDKRRILEYYGEAARLTRESGVLHVVDHIYPLQGKTVSGLHVPDNLQVIPSRINASKGNRHPELVAVMNHDLW